MGKIVTGNYEAAATLTGASTTYWFALGDCGNSQTDTETVCLQTLRQACSINDLGVRVTGNTRTTATTITVRKNQVNTGLTLTIPAATNGWILGSGGPISFSSGDKISISVVTGGDSGNTLNLGPLLVSMTTTGATCKQYMSAGNTSIVAGSGNYFNVAGLTYSGGPANSCFPVVVSGTLSNLFIRVTANTLTGSATFKSAISTTDVNGTFNTESQTITLASSSGTGDFEDQINTDSISSGNQLSVVCSSFSGSGTLTVSNVGMKVTNAVDDGTCGLVSFRHSSMTLGSSTDYFPMVGEPAEGFGSTIPELRLPFSGTLSKLYQNCYYNPSTTSTNLQVAKNGTAGNLLVTVVPNTSTYQTVYDLTHIDSFASSDDLEYTTNGYTGTTPRFNATAILVGSSTYASSVAGTGAAASITGAVSPGNLAVSASGSATSFSNSSSIVLSAAIGTGTASALTPSLPPQGGAAFATGTAAGVSKIDQVTIAAVGGTGIAAPPNILDAPPATATGSAAFLVPSEGVTTSVPAIGSVSPVLPAGAASLSSISSVGSAAALTEIVSKTAPSVSASGFVASLFGAVSVLGVSAVGVSASAGIGPFGASSVSGAFGTGQCASSTATPSPAIFAATAGGVAGSAPIFAFSGVSATGTAGAPALQAATSAINGVSATGVIGTLGFSKALTASSAIGFGIAGSAIADPGANIFAGLAIGAVGVAVASPQPPPAGVFGAGTAASITFSAGPQPISALATGYTGAISTALTYAPASAIGITTASPATAGPAVAGAAASATGFAQSLGLQDQPAGRSAISSGVCAIVAPAPAASITGVSATAMAANILPFPAPTPSPAIASGIAGIASGGEIVSISGAVGSGAAAIVIAGTAKGVAAVSAATIAALIYANDNVLPLAALGYGNAGSILARGAFIQKIKMRGSKSLTLAVGMTALQGEIDQ